MAHVLLVDDDGELRALLTGYLRGFRIQVTPAASAAELHHALAAEPKPPFDLVLLDLMLPDGDGLDLCRWLRRTRALPVIMLTAKGDPASRIVGLELGADDYLAKPFEPRELVARIHAVLRRSAAPAAAQPSHVLHFAGWRFDLLQHQLCSPQQVVLVLSNAEYRLLSTFVGQPRRVLSRERLLALVRTGEPADDAPAALRAIDLAVSRLRQKLGDSAREAELIRTVRGEGYVFNADVT